MKIFYSVLAVIFFSILSCENQNQKEERLAKKYCGSCHTFPDPGLLDKKTWEKHVFPEMAFRMGLDNTPLNTMPFEDQRIIQMTLPDLPMVSNENWERIKKYYLLNAPDSLIAPEQHVMDSLKLFEAEPIRLSVEYHHAITLIEYDSLSDKIYLGTRPGRLYQLDRHFNVLDSVQLRSAPSKIRFRNNEDPLALLMGIMDPNEQSLGNITVLRKQAKGFTKVIDSLQRPVDFEKADLNNDGVDDYVVCNFGNFTGALVAYQGIEKGKFRRHILQHLPGARKIIIRDFDGNGMPDILALMTQADERIILLYNQGNFQFRMSTLLRFDAVYGSSYFEVADFNNDGKFDILYTNGDNADYSPTLKPYHGVRIFLNSGTTEFKESFFYPMHGASQARVVDFDNDGDLDIAAISFFPDFKNHPDHGFIYLENTSDGFTPHVTPLASKGRWITMEAADYDRDGDVDILLGSLAFPTRIPEDLFKQWRMDQVSVLLLKNNLRNTPGL
jgi:hypothetical protein